MLLLKGMSARCEEEVARAGMNIEPEQPGHVSKESLETMVLRVPCFIQQTSSVHICPTGNVFQRVPEWVVFPSASLQANSKRLPSHPFHMEPDVRVPLPFTCYTQNWKSTTLFPASLQLVVWMEVKGGFPIDPPQKPRVQIQFQPPSKGFPEIRQPSSRGLHDGQARFTPGELEKKCPDISQMDIPREIRGV